MILMSKLAYNLLKFDVFSNVGKMVDLPNPLSGQILHTNLIIID